MSADWGSFVPIASLLVPVTLKDPRARPDSASDAITVPTVSRFLLGGQSVQPAAGIPEIIGGVLSMFTLAMAGLLTLPALSVQVPEADCPAPSPINVIGPVQKSIPD